VDIVTFTLILFQAQFLKMLSVASSQCRTEYDQMSVWCTVVDK